VLAKKKSYYSREWKEGNKWSLSTSIKEEPRPWGSANTWQVKPWEVVEGNIKDQTTTPTIHEIIYSKRISFEGIRDGEGSYKDKEERRIETPLEDYHKGWCKNQL
jgi:stalled ribosome alternative rescue factor ArfA